MSWTIDQLLRHPKWGNLLKVNTKSKVQATKKEQVSENSPAECAFVVVGAPVGKPRMTQRDRWKKRPVVLRYYDYCDRIKEAVPNQVLTGDVYAIEVTAHIAMPASWSLKKKNAHKGQMCRSKPDWDNIGKAVCDALFKEDARISDGRTRKFWCLEGEQRTEIKVQFYA